MICVDGSQAGFGRRFKIAGHGSVVNGPDGGDDIAEEVGDLTSRLRRPSARDLRRWVYLREEIIVHESFFGHH